MKAFLFVGLCLLVGSLAVNARSANHTPPPAGDTASSSSEAVRGELLEEECVLPTPAVNPLDEARAVAERQALQSMQSALQDALNFQDEQNSINQQQLELMTLMEQRITEGQSAVDARLGTLEQQLADVNLKLAEMQIASLAAAMAPQEPEIMELEIDYIEPPTATEQQYLNDANGYLTTAGIRQWLKTHNVGSRWDIGSNSDPWEHLMDGSDGTHVWRDWQIEGLTYNEAMSLHSATHNNRITPTTRIEAEAFMLNSDSTAGVPIYWRNNQWEWSHGGKGYHQFELYEGWESADGQFRYKDGRMLVYELVTPQATRSTTVASAPSRPRQQPVYQSYSNCPSGNCPSSNRGFFGWRRGR